MRADTRTRQGSRDATAHTARHRAGAAAAPQAPPAPHGAGLGLLGNTANIAATAGHSTDNDGARQRNNRGDRRALRRALRPITTLKRLRHCGRTPVEAVDGVRLMATDTGAYYSGLQTCASIWCCPVCAPRIRERRAQEIEEGLAVHLDGGGGAGFLTLTMAHDFGDRLVPLLDAIADAFRSMLGSRGWREDRDRFAIVGNIRSTDITHGRNGWHPHLHVLVLTERPLTGADWAALAERVWQRWRSAIERHGYRPPTRERGVTLSAVRSRDEVASYTAKLDDGWPVGRELTRHDLKTGRRRGRTPMEIAREAATGTPSDRWLWREYETATSGRHAIQWSRGLKARLRVGERDDEELAAEDQTGEPVATLDVDEWAYVCRHDLDTHLLNLAETSREELEEELVEITIGTRWEREQRRRTCGAFP